jgi:hypothetical protein
MFQISFCEFSKVSFSPSLPPHFAKQFLLPDFLNEPGVAALGLLAHHPGNCATTPRE